MRKGLNSLIILVAWEIWKHRNVANVCVFEGASPNVQEVLHAVTIEGFLWCMSGTSALEELLLQSLIT
jgi:hypothetical protein